MKKIFNFRSTIAICAAVLFTLAQPKAFAAVKCKDNNYRSLLIDLEKRQRVLERWIPVELESFKKQSKMAKSAKRWYFLAKAGAFVAPVMAAGVVGVALGAIAGGAVSSAAGVAGLGSEVLAGPVFGGLVGGAAGITFGVYVVHKYVSIEDGYILENLKNSPDLSKELVRVIRMELKNFDDSRVKLGKLADEALTKIENSTGIRAYFSREASFAKTMAKKYKSIVELHQAELLFIKGVKVGVGEACEIL